MNEDEERAVTDDERWYDENIKPDLARLAKLCKEHGLPFLAEVTWREGDEWGSETTRYIPEFAPLAILWAAMAVQCRGNVDSLFMAIAREAKERGRDTDASMVFNLVFKQPA